MSISQTQNCTHFEKSAKCAVAICGNVELKKRAIDGVWRALGAKIDKLHTAHATVAVAVKNAGLRRCDFGACENRGRCPHPLGSFSPNPRSRGARQPRAGVGKDLQPLPALSIGCVMSVNVEPLRGHDPQDQRNVNIDRRLRGGSIAIFCEVCRHGYKSGPSSCFVLGVAGLMLGFLSTIPFASLK